jgi:hypothetical protein
MSLTTGAAPPQITTTQGQTVSPPDWYNQMVQNVAAQGMNLASQGYPGYTGNMLADFNNTQQIGFQNAYQNQGAWQPAFDSAMNTATGVMPQVQQQVGAGNQYAQNASQLADPNGANSWANSYQQYMSPYTSSVVNEIGRLGTQNLMENVIPGVQDQFVGAGQFGSTRNADILGRAIRDTQTNISGLQSQALQSGYGTAANIYGQAQGLGVNANLGAAQAANTGAGTLGYTGNTNAGLQGSLANQQQSQLGNDVNQLLNIGGQQQALTQQGYNTAYQQYQNALQYPWTQMQNLGQTMSQFTLPQQVTNASSQPLPGAQYGASPLNYALAAYGASNLSGQNNNGQNNNGGLPNYSNFGSNNGTNNPLGYGSKNQ